jgi:hypothetical protein
MNRLPNPPLVPSSMSAGNTVATDPALSMTAPGSPSILPVPDALDRLPLPVNSGAEIPVSTERDRTEGNPAPGGMGPWTDITETGNGGWKQL